ncbi:MAG: DUF3536 domain-containing protein [Halobacteria archaeon]
MERYVCIHGHFYQPPRENPWLEAVELQDSAYPYHDWNERVTAECYAPNAVSRILDEEGRIVSLVNNYSRISFNFGPTLLAWLEARAPDVYRAVLDADRRSRGRFSGHGSAIAQAYNHAILPLANRRDKRTQILWGVRDFEHRFGRRPEGMWLPETAVDLETLSLLEDAGIRFTILAPTQARRVRRLGEEEWRDVSGGRVDPTTAYRVGLPTGRKMALFFYDGPISRAVAFERLLTNGERFARRLLDGFSTSRPWPQLVHIAADGETYGHHHRHGDMALAYALRRIESDDIARLTNYGEFLAKHPPAHEVEIFENTSWSCAHGVERWRGDCGCASGGRPGWNQSWRAPLREALDRLRDEAAPLFEQRARSLLKDPWAARDDYISILLDRSPESHWRFMERHAVRQLSEGEVTAALKLLELQRHAMLMYTSCGWFFDELSGIEAVQVLQYAGRVVQLAGELFGADLESGLLARLERARSNIPACRDGRNIYERSVRPSVVDWERLGAHYGVSSLFESYPADVRLDSYHFHREEEHRKEVGRARLVMGRVRVTSVVTRESATLGFGAVHLGDHNLHGGVLELRGREAFGSAVREISGAFSRADFAEVLRLMDRHFGESTYSLRSLFRDEQRKVAELVLASVTAEVEEAYRRVYAERAPLMRFLDDVGVPFPRPLRMTAELVLNVNLRRAFEAGELDRGRIGALLQEAHEGSIPLDEAGLEFALRKTIESAAERLSRDPADLSLLRQLEDAVGLARALSFEVNFWKTQNLYYEMLQSAAPEFRGRAAQGDEKARVWMDLFLTLGRNLRIRVD